MKMQIWKVHIVDGVLAATHGWSCAIYEGFVPDLKLTINHVTSFVNEDCSRYEDHDQENEITPTPQPELICEVELSSAQIEDMKFLADENNPENRIEQLIAATLKDKGLDASDYEDSVVQTDQLNSEIKD